MRWVRLLMNMVMVWVALLSMPIMAAAGSPEATQGLPTVRPSAIQVPSDWISLRGVHGVIHTDPDHTKLAKQLLDHTEESVPRLASAIRVSEGAPVHVYLAQTEDQFFAMQPGRAPTWADATAYPQSSMVFLRVPAARRSTSPLLEVLDHELVHIQVGRKFAPNRPPTWLQEGLAQMHAEMFDSEDLRVLARGAWSGPPKLSELERSFPANAHEASVAYAASHDFLVWLNREYGTRATAALVDRMSMGVSLHQALYDVTGQPIEVIDERWRSRFGFGSRTFYLALFSVDSFWAWSAVLGLIAILVVRRRERRRREMVREQERAQRRLIESLWEDWFRIR